MAQYLNNRALAESRYRLTGIYLDDWVYPGRRRYGTWRAPEIDLTEYDRHVVTATEVGRLDLIAYNWYKNPEFWWVLAWVNEIPNPITDMVVGAVLIIPKINNITRAFSGAVSR